MLTVLALCAFFGVIAVGLLALGVISDFEDKLFYLSPDESMQRSRHKIAIELESLVKPELFQKFYVFSDHSVSVDELKSKKFSVVSNNNWKATDSFLLKGLVHNTCKRKRCFQYPVEFKNIPSSIWKGLIGVEDERFLNHKGVDIKSLFRALWVDLINMKKVQGGSTITQQLIKNLFLTNEKTITRKVKEIILAVYFEFKYSKEEILTIYLNEMNWGALQGVQVKGIYAASVFYFNKKPKDLTVQESAILIGMLKGPYYYRPLNDVERIKKRTKVVLGKLKRDNFISDKNSEIWSDQTWKNWQNKIKKKNKDVDILAYINIDFKNNDFSQYDQFLINYYSLKATSQNKGNFAQKISVKKINCPSCSHYYFYTKFERSRDEAFKNEFHQVGSTIKPIVYQSLYELGMRYTDFVSTERMELKLRSGIWKPKDKITEDEMTVRKALQLSKNNPIVRLASEIGFLDLEKSMKRKIPKLKTPLSEFPAQLLGAVELSLDEISDMYQSFLKKECQLVNSNIDLYDTTLGVLSDPTLTTIKSRVRSPLSEASFFGKTGTTNKGKDALFIGIDGEYIYTVWSGYESSSDKDKPLSGSRTSFGLFQNFIKQNGSRFTDINCDIFAR